MEFRQLRYFIAVAEIGNIGLAAQRLNVSQPPVSRQIQALEHELDVKLLIRTPRGVELTEAGRVFYHEAVKILSSADMLRKRTAEADKGALGTLDVAFFGSPVYRAVPVALRAFRRAFPNTDVNLSRMGKADQIDAIREGRIHIGFGRYYTAEPGIVLETIGEESLFAAVPKDSPLARRDELTLADLTATPAVLFPSDDRPGFADEVIGMFKAKSVPMVIDTFAAETMAALAQVASGNRYCIVPGSVAALGYPTLAFRPIIDCTIRAPISCVFAEGEPIPILAQFLKSLRALSLSSFQDT